jgi:hypothetical protein
VCRAGGPSADLLHNGARIENRPMPIDFLTVHEKIRSIGAGAGERRQRLEQKRKQARGWLDKFGSDVNLLRGRVEAAAALDPNLRCALPVHDALNVSHARPARLDHATLIAADGSQTFPDRHAQFQFCVINVAAIVMRPSSGELPEIHQRTELHYGDELEAQGLTSEGAINLRRDLNERTAVDQVSETLQGRILSFTDGPVELWGAKDGTDPRAYEAAVQSHITSLSRQQSRGVTVAGYVDKPAADLVIRLLELASGFPDKREELRSYRPLHGVSDRWLFGGGNHDFQLLGPGERSAVFGLQSGSSRYYTGSLALHFFYLNVGVEAHPWPVRVEIPRWVAEERDQLDLLHAELVDQCRMLGNRPYPYLLHRAHESALVTQAEKSQIEQMLAQELRNQDEALDEGSYKQSAKSLAGRIRT